MARFSTVAVPNQPWALAIGDIDADGDVDLAAASGYDNKVGIRFNGPGSPLAVASARSLHLSLYPNPAHDRVTVLAPLFTTEKEGLLLLTDAVGRCLRTIRVPIPATGLNTEVNLSGLAPGLYQLHVQIGADTAVKKLIVE